MTLKFCSKCNKEKDIESFCKNKSRKDGRQIYCRECKKIFDGNYYAANKHTHIERVHENRKKLRQEINELKSSIGCAFCPENDPCCLDFHHPDKNKIASVGNLVDRLGRNKTFDEIKKCLVVCSNCHRKIHAGRKLIASMLVTGNERVS